jgi:DNA-binding MarR family transcriptional regulator
MSGRNITETEETLGAILRLPFQILAKRLYEELAATGYPDIRSAHGSVFRYILPEGSRVSELAERAQMTKQSMAYLVESLRESGYVEVEPDPTDGRARRVCLTDRGLEVQRKGLEISRRMENEIAEQMGAERLSELRTLLHELHFLLKPTKS